MKCFFLNNDDDEDQQLLKLFHHHLVQNADVYEELAIVGEPCENQVMLQEIV